MTLEKFNDFVSSLFEGCASLLTRKGVEYEKSADRLANFKRAAMLQHETPEKALFGMLAKHIVSIADLCAESGDRDIPLELWDEKIMDGISYLVLLRALAEESKCYCENEESLYE